MIKLNSLDKHPDIHHGQMSSLGKDSRISINQFRHGISFFQNNTRLFNTHKALLLFEKECTPVLYVPKSEILFITDNPKVHAMLVSANCVVYVVFIAIFAMRLGEVARNIVE